MFKDIKVGDKVAIIASCGISSWNTTHFSKSFVTHIEVERITKTQFIAGGMRFKKDTGCEFGSGYTGCTSRKITGTIKNYSGTVDLSVDQSKELHDHKKKVALARNVIEREHGCFDMYRCKSLDDVHEAARLLSKLKAIAPCERRG